MKKTKIIIPTCLLTLCLYAPNVLAMKESIFPDNTVLQPMPDGTPNISGNVDWSNTASNTINANTSISSNQSETNTTTNTSNPQNSQNDSKIYANNANQNLAAAQAQSSQNRFEEKTVSNNNSNLVPAPNFPSIDAYEDVSSDQRTKSITETDQDATKKEILTDQNDETSNPTWPIVYPTIGLLVLISIIWIFRKTENSGK